MAADLTSAPATTTLRILLYSSAGNGKTSAAFTAPSPIILINADRPTASRAARKRNPQTEVIEVQFAGAETLTDVYLRVKNGETDAQTVVLDTVGEAYRMLLDQAAGSAARPSLAQYGEAQTKIDRWVRAMRDLPVNLVLVCHEEIKDDDEGRIVRPFTGGKNTPEVIMGQMDVVAYVKVVTAENGEAKAIAQLSEARGRRAKDGTGELGVSREANLSEWIAAVS